MKKILLLGSLISVVAPIALVTSCDSKQGNTEDDKIKTPKGTTATKEAPAIATSKIKPSSSSNEENALGKERVKYEPINLKEAKIELEEIINLDVENFSYSNNIVVGSETEGALQIQFQTTKPGEAFGTLIKKDSRILITLLASKEWVSTVKINEDSKMLDENDKVEGLLYDYLMYFQKYTTKANDDFKNRARLVLKKNKQIEKKKLLEAFSKIEIAKYSFQVQDIVKEYQVISDGVFKYSAKSTAPSGAELKPITYIDYEG